MSIFTYHLLKTDLITALKFYTVPIQTKGIIHSESMISMTLGSAIFSPSRLLFRQVAIFAQWDSEADLKNYLENNNLGKKLAKGWHVKMKFTRQWGKISKFKIPKTTIDKNEENETVIAVTLASMQFLQIPRFINWGRPVEKLVRDHPSTYLSLASIRFPRLVSTFSIWKNEKEMTNMVHGHSKISQPKRHSKAMVERERKDFHIEFTTLRFKPISEHGTWKGNMNFTYQN